MQNTVELCLKLWYHHKVYEKVYGRSFEGGSKGRRSGGSPHRSGNSERRRILLHQAYNMTETAKDPTAHAEIEAIRQAAKNLAAGG